MLILLLWFHARFQHLLHSKKAELVDQSVEQLLAIDTDYNSSGNESNYTGKGFTLLSSILCSQTHLAKIISITTFAVDNKPSDTITTNNAVVTIVANRMVGSLVGKVEVVDNAEVVVVVMANNPNTADFKIDLEDQL